MRKKVTTMTQTNNSSFIPRSDLTQHTECKAVHGLAFMTRFYLKGPKGVIQFWFETSIRGFDSITDTPTAVRITPVDLGYHSREPLYPDQSSRDDCELLDGAKCYYDGSSLQAAGLFREWITSKDDNIIWKELQEHYEYRFEGKVINNDNG